MRFEEKKIVKKKFYAARKTYKIWNVNVDNIVVLKLVEKKTSSKYLIGIIIHKATKPLVLIMPKMSRCVKTFKVEDRINKLMSLRIYDEKLLEKYKPV